MARFTDVLLDLLANAHELLPLGRGRFELRAERVELKRYSDETLQQRVVNLPTEPGTLADEHRELTPNVSKPQLPESPGRETERQNAGGVEPCGLVEHRFDGEWPCGRRSSPRAVCVTRRNTENVVAGR